ncbi:hypothetical protein [Clostridium saudiense]|uniref:hypothetical protein n=1 Tax=Clostridium saudiense TaxID=1414720 RepID=UPI0026734215|nr:hypothetical protein [Clostridium saudiense]
MFDDLGIVREAISDTELLILSIGEGKEIIVQASKDYVSSIRAELNDEDGETIIVEYDLKTKVVNESIIN